MTVTLDDLRRHARRDGRAVRPALLHDEPLHLLGRAVSRRAADLLDAAGLRNDAPGDFKRMVFIAHAHDGYAVTFSWHELFNTPSANT